MVVVVVPGGATVDVHLYQWLPKKVRECMRTVHACCSTVHLLYRKIIGFYIVNGVIIQWLIIPIDVVQFIILMYTISSWLPVAYWMTVPPVGYYVICFQYLILINGWILCNDKVTRRGGMRGWILWDSVLLWPLYCCQSVIEVVYPTVEQPVVQAIMFYPL